MSSGRAWKTSELRLKSFDDLHKLWFVMLKERNRLQTERLYYKQLGMQQPDHTRMFKVKKGMARIRLVLGERSRVHKAKKALEEADQPKPEPRDRSEMVWIKKFGKWFKTWPEKYPGPTRRQKKILARYARYKRMRDEGLLQPTEGTAEKEEFENEYDRREFRAVNLRRDRTKALRRRDFRAPPRGTVESSTLESPNE